MTQEQTKTPLSFEGLGIKPGLLTQLTKLNFTIPTPIQHQLIPIAIKGEDVVGIAQTGTGKTLAFAIPIIQKIALIKGMALVIAPTRELALQIDETFRKLGSILNLRTTVLIGGAPMGMQIIGLRNGNHIIVGTPGRILDHLQQKTLRLDNVHTVVLDEADRMLDMGFEPDIKKILGHLKKDGLQTMLFSATMPENISKIANTYLKKPLRIEVSPVGSAATDVEQEIFIVSPTKKEELLKKILTEYTGSVLMFCRTKYGVQKLARIIGMSGHTATEIHSNRSLAQRKQALAGFKSGRYRVLVATDIASRGIDVIGISLVINYDLPEKAEDYVHRIGRTGRAGLSGKAISFVAPEQKYSVKTIEKLIKTTLAVKTVEGITEKIQEGNFIQNKNKYAPKHRSFNRRFKR